MQVLLTLRESTATWGHLKGKIKDYIQFKFTLTNIHTQEEMSEPGWDIGLGKEEEEKAEADLINGDITGVMKNKN